MSTGDLEALRARALAEGKRLGWKRFGEAAGLDGETLRQFAHGPQGRSAHPSTLSGLRGYFSPAPSDLQAKAARALDLFREGQELLTEVVHQIAMLPPTEEQAAQIAALDTPMPTVKRNAGGRRTGGTSG